MNATTSTATLIDTIRSAVDTQSLIAAQAAALTGGADAAAVISAATERAKQLQSWSEVAIKATKSHGIYCRASGSGISCKTVAALLQFLGQAPAIADVVRNAIDGAPIVDAPTESKDRGKHAVIGGTPIAIGVDIADLKALLDKIR